MENSRVITDIRELGENYRIVWEPQPGPQTNLLTCPVYEVFYGGARGGGKTDGALGDWASHASKYGSAANGIMLRRERTQLIDTIERSKILFSSDGKYNEQDKSWRFHNGARFRFAYLENDSDAEVYQGHSYTKVYVEELTNFPSPKPIMKMMACLRSGNGVPCTFRATGNPGGPGHGWVKQRYIDPAPQGYKIIKEQFKNPWTDEIVERDRVYIPAKVTDNNKIDQSQYIANLQMLADEELVKAWLDGDWNVAIGSFLKTFSKRHIVPAFKPPDHWFRLVSFDYGFSEPTAVTWWCVSDGEVLDLQGQQLYYPANSLICYREWYTCNPENTSEGLGLTCKELCDGLRKRAGTEKIWGYVADSKPFATERDGKNIAEEMGNYGIELRRADTKRVQGWLQVKNRLKGFDDIPHLYIMANCLHTIRTIPLLQTDDHNVEDAEMGGEDHLPDTIRYACMTRPITMHKKDEEPKFLHQAKAQDILKQHFKIKAQRGVSRR